MNYLRIILAFYITFFMLSSTTQATPTITNIYMPPPQISCYNDPSSDLNRCEGFDNSYLTVSNRDSNLPRTPVILNFTDGYADYYGHPTFIYHDTNWHYVTVLGPASFTIRANIDDSAWVKKFESYTCTHSSGQCPIYKS